MINGIYQNLRKELIKSGIISNNFRVQNYRCFDQRVIYYDTNFVARLNTKVLGHFKSKNYSLISTRQLADNNFKHIFVSNIISDQCFISNKTKEEVKYFHSIFTQKPQPNKFIRRSSSHTQFKHGCIVNKMAKDLGMFFTWKTDFKTQTVETNQLYPIDILDYIYAVLHSC